jgi:hypothetical protein
VMPLWRRSVGLSPVGPATGLRANVVRGTARFCQQKAAAHESAFVAGVGNTSAATQGKFYSKQNILYTEGDAWVETWVRRWGFVSLLVSEASHIPTMHSIEGAAGAAWLDATAPCG